MQNATHSATQKKKGYKAQLVTPCFNWWAVTGSNRGPTDKKSVQLSAIRQHCIWCVGGSENGHKPLKRIRECQDKDCALHPFRMGKNPFDKRNLTETQRKAKAALINSGHFPDNLS